MTRPPKPSAGIRLAIVAASMMFCARYVMAVQSGIGHGVALRTYVFWALVCAPVTYLAEVLLRSAMDYRPVRMVVARVKTRR